MHSLLCCAKYFSTSCYFGNPQKPVVPPQDQAGHVTPQNQVKHGEEKPEVKKEESGKINNANVVGVQPEAWEGKVA